MNILETQSLQKSYGAVQALRGVSLQVPKGSVFGLLGPNGSGKTTLLGILLDVLKADAGEYRWTGFTDAVSARLHIGALLETPNFYPYLSAAQNMEWRARVKGCGTDRIDAVLQEVGLLDRKHSPFSTFSLGMKQRLAIAGALLCGPDILVLDEPTNGLDPAGIAEIRNLIRKLNQEGCTVILASHLLDEVEKVCTHVAIMRKGELLTQGPVGEILRGETTYEVDAQDRKALLAALKNHPLVATVRDETPFRITLRTDAMIEDLNRSLMLDGLVLSHLLRRQASLESTFIELTQNS